MLDRSNRSFRFDEVAKNDALTYYLHPSIDNDFRVSKGGLHGCLESYIRE